MKTFGCSFGYIAVVQRRKPCIHYGHYSVKSLPPWKSFITDTQQARGLFAFLNVGRGSEGLTPLSTSKYFDAVNTVEILHFHYVYKEAFQSRGGRCACMYDAYEAYIQ